MRSRARMGAMSVAIMLMMGAGGLSAAESGADEAERRPRRFRQQGLRVHDPSTIVQCQGEYWLFATGRGIVSRRSKDLVTWTVGPPVFTTAPAWTTEAVPGNRGHLWAPDIIHLKDRYLLYYSISTWGVNTSAIGLVTNSTLDPADPNYRWVDEGLVVQSRRTDDFNAIDPGLTLDADGRLWMALGSFWTGIKLIELDPATGKRVTPEVPIRALAHHESIEAPCIYPHDGAYYLFVNWGQCCRGMNSTYTIRVGRSAEITGPYLDQAGIDLLRDGGTPFLETKGHLIGPGHAAIFTEGAAHWLSYHYYDGAQRGAATLGLRRLRWNADGWPEPGEPLDLKQGQDTE